MKVCTDSCLFGAWIGDLIENKILQPQNILDIGSGTGLLSLMLAQKSEAGIDGIEIDKNSFEQTKLNFEDSQWSHRLQAFHGDIKSYISGKKYDLVISNPPFFENDLRSGNQNKNVAKHDEGLTLHELLIATKKYLNQNGNFAVLLPFHRIEQFKSLAADHKLFPRREVIVKQSNSHPFFRGMLLLGGDRKELYQQEISIKNKAGNYTEEFNRLLKDYYL